MVHAVDTWKEKYSGDPVKCRQITKQQHVIKIREEVDEDDILFHIPLIPSEECKYSLLFIYMTETQ